MDMLDWLFLIGAIIGCRYFLLRNSQKQNNEGETMEVENFEHVAKTKANIDETKAIVPRNPNDIVEIYRRPAVKPGTQADYLVPYKAPEKPIPQKPKITAVRTSSSSPSFVTRYKPNKLIEPVIECTREKYQLPTGAVDMPLEETAVIVAVILYFINEDDRIGITKLESYVIMLDYMCWKETGQRLFSYRLTYGTYGYYIQNFRAFLDFIEEKKILTKRRKYYDRKKYRMDFTAHHDVPDDFFPEKLLDWMEDIADTWRDAGARHTKRDVLKQFSPKALEAFTSVPMFDD